MILDTLLQNHGSTPFHRLVIEQPDGSLLEVDASLLLKVFPVDRVEPTAELPEGRDGNWSGVLVRAEDQGRSGKGEQVIVLRAVAD